jgi:hypothetical protein
MAPAVRRGVRGAAIAFTAASAVWLAAPHVRELVRGRARLADLPHFTGVLTSARAIDEAGTLAETLAEEARAGRRPFVCAHQAGFWQLVSGIPNPTPFDYTMNASFGPTGQAAVIAAIVDGRIGVVWLDPDMPRAMRPTELEDYIRSHLVRDGSAGDFEVWRARR